jgi:hypothetical protein
MEDPNLGKDRPLREQSIDKVAGALQNIGFDQYSSYKTARQLLGNPTAQNISESIGVLDFTPLQIPFAIQEAKRAFDKGDYVESALTGGFSALETLPFMKLVSTPVKSFFKSLGSKMTSETPTDLSKRKTLGAIAAAPVAVGALSEVPVGKIMEDVMPTSDIPVVKPVASKIAGAVVENVGQPSRTRVINELMDFTDFGKGPQYGDETMKESVENFSSELNKSKKYFEMKKKAVDQDELDMISSNSEMSDYLENLQIQFGYTDDEIINFINKTDSTTRKNTKVWETYLEFGGSEGDPDVGKKLGLGDESENWENWSENELWEKFYGSNEEDIVGKIISEVSE